MLSLIIFNGIYRIEDNMALINAISKTDNLIPIFIFDKYYQKKQHHRDFMFNIMKEMYNEFKKNNIYLYCFSLDISSIIKNITKITSIKSIYINKTYTYPESIIDKSLVYICKNYDIELNIYNDILLTEIDKPLNYDLYIDTFYTLDTKTTIYIDKPDTRTLYNLIKSYPNVFSKTRYIFNKCIDIENTDFKQSFNISGKIWNDFIEINGNDYSSKFKNLIIKGTRKDGINILNEQKYNETYNYYILLPYIRFGIISSREVYHKIVTQYYNGLLLNISKSSILQYLLKRDHIYNLNRFDSYRVFNPIKYKQQTKKIISKDIFINANTNIPVIDACIRQIIIQGITDPKIKFIMYRYYKLYVINKDTDPTYFNNSLDYDDLIDREMWNSIIDSKSNYLDVDSYINRHNIKHTINKWLLQQELHRPYNRII